MTYIEKQILYDAFLSKWKTKFERVPAIVKYLSSFPKFIKGFDAGLTLKEEDFHASQLQWVSLINQFYHPLDKAFFKEYWVPIFSEDYGYYIDISSDKFTFLIVDFHCFNEGIWSEIILIEDLETFILELGSKNFSNKAFFKKLEEAKYADLVKALGKAR